VKCYIWSVDSYGSEILTLRKVDQNYPGNFLNAILVKDGAISWIDRLKNEEVLQRIKEERNILPETIQRKSNWIGHILRMKCLLKHVIQGKIEGKRSEKEDVSSSWMNLRN
jgi:hypothetical protein